MTATKILVVEDEGIIAKDIQFRLGRMGYDVLKPVATGKAAIEETEQHHPDLILMDIMIKGDMDGIQTTEQIHKHFNIPVIYLTANSDSGTVDRAKLTTPYGFLLKPFKDTDAQISIDMAVYKHQAEQKLKEKDEELITFLNCVGDAVIATDKKGKVTFMNPAGEVLTGWSVDEALGQNLDNVAHIFDAVTHEPLSTIVPDDQTDIKHRDHILLMAKNGSNPAVEHTSAPVMDETHTRLGSVVVLRDVTEREEAEAELRQHREKLRELVAERTRELTEANDELTREIYQHKKTTLSLQRAKEKAEAAVQVKSDFLANMSHEIRTPMHGVLGLTELLLLSDLNDAQRRHAEGVIGSGQALISIVDDILDFSKIEAGKLEMESIPFNLQEILNNTIVPLHPKAEEKGLELTLHYATGVPKQFAGAPNRVRQIITNIVGNAIKFTNEGYVNVNVDCISQREDNVEMRIQVSDTGIGIKQEDTARIFEMFSQADTSITRQYGGTGLGLAITQRLVEMMSGTIKVESEVGKGTTFSVTIPFTTDIKDRNHRNIPNTSEESDNRSFSDSITSKILLVEDNEMNQKVAQGYLEAFGMGYDLAVNGEEAIEMAAKKDYGLILMDIQMPGKSGLEAAKIIRDNDTTRRVPIVAMTAHAMESDRKRSLDAGLDDHITKPLQFKTIKAILDKYLNVDNT